MPKSVRVGRVGEVDEYVLGYVGVRELDGSLNRGFKESRFSKLILASLSQLCSESIGKALRRGRYDIIIHHHSSSYSHRPSAGPACSLLCFNPTDPLSNNLNLSFFIDDLLFTDLTAPILPVAIKDE